MDWISAWHGEHEGLATSTFPFDCSRDANVKSLQVDLGEQQPDVRSKILEIEHTRFCLLFVGCAAVDAATKKDDVSATPPAAAEMCDPDEPSRHEASAPGPVHQSDPIYGASPRGGLSPGSAVTAGARHSGARARPQRGSADRSACSDSDNHIRHRHPKAAELLF